MPRGGKHNGDAKHDVVDDLPPPPFSKKTQRLVHIHVARCRYSPETNSKSTTDLAGLVQSINRRAEFGKVLVDKQQHFKFLFLFLQSTNLIRNRTALTISRFSRIFKRYYQSCVVSSFKAFRSMCSTENLSRQLITSHSPTAGEREKKNDPLRYWVPRGTKMNGRRESFHAECRRTTKRKLGKTNTALIRQHKRR